MLSDVDIGKKIARIRRENGLSQEKMAEVLDLGERTKVSKIERGKQSMNANELIRFCEYFNVSLDSLIDDRIISSEDYKAISERYINNNTIGINERKETVRLLYIELAQKELDISCSVLVKHKNTKNSDKSAEITIEKYELQV